jgi:signal transduction histidine kinase
MIDMRVERSAENLGCRFIKDVQEHFFSPESLYCQAIENADGVPYQLVFGPEPGDGYYMNVGTGIKQLIGISPGEFTESAYNSLVEEVIPLSPDISPDLSLSRLKFRNGEIKNYKAEVLVRMPSGEKKWIQDSSLPVTDKETGRVIGALGILFDINESKKTLGTLEKVMEKAEESDRLKTAFLNNISHEIRTPLNAIVGFSALLSEPENDPQSRKEFIDIITRSTDHLLEIISNIVELSNIEASEIKVNKSKVNLNSVVRRVFDRYRPKAVEQNICLCMASSMDDNEVNIMTDGFKISQVLTNLVSNAMKFTIEGEVIFGYTIRDQMIEFYVSDTGIGISAEHHSMIFSRFYQTESSFTRRFEGTGLGLAISKAYVELMGGKIWFTSNPGEGSVFYFTVPYEKADML